MSTDNEHPAKRRRQHRRQTVRVPAPINAHSHAFHRILRGRTHEGADGGAGTFWTWREHMYAAAHSLTPAGYQQLATAVFAEMVATGYSAVGEFHYLHHQNDGTPYGAEGSDTEPHAMELALGRAALAAGIRLVLLDTCYLQGGLAADGSVLPLDADPATLQRRHRRRRGSNATAAWPSR